MIKETLKLRNQLVHNKSEEMKFEFSTFESVCLEPSANEDPLGETYQHFLNDCKEDFDCAYKAIRGIALLAKYFEENDPTSHASIRVFSFSGIYNEFPIQNTETIDSLISKIQI